MAQFEANRLRAFSTEVDGPDPLLVRPDGYVAARGKRWDAAAFRAAVDAVVPRPAALERV